MFWISYLLQPISVTCSLLGIRVFWVSRPHSLVKINFEVTNCRLIFFIIKPTRCTNFPNLLRHETLHVSGSSSAPHQEFIHCTLGTGICHTGLKTTLEQDQDGTDGTAFHPGPARKLSSNLYDIYQCRVYSE